MCRTKIGGAINEIYGLYRSERPPNKNLRRLKRSLVVGDPGINSFGLWFSDVFCALGMSQSFMKPYCIAAGIKFKMWAMVSTDWKVP